MAATKPQPVLLLLVSLLALSAPCMRTSADAADRALDEVAGNAKPDNARPPRDAADLRYWLENMVWHHRFMTGEIRAATGLSDEAIGAALKRFDIQPETKPKRPADA